MSEQIRLPGLAPDAWTDKVRLALTGTIEPVAAMEAPAGTPKRNDPLNILTVMAHHPHVLPTFLPWATTLALEGTLAPSDAELLALRVAWLAESEFEWGHHVVYAHAAGMNDDQIAAITEGSSSPSWAEPQRALLDAADQLVADHQIDDATWDRLRAHFDEAQLVEIPLVVGQYTMLSMVANMLGVPLEPGHPGLPDRPA